MKSLISFSSAAFGFVVARALSEDVIASVAEQCPVPRNARKTEIVLRFTRLNDSGGSVSPDN